MTHKFPDGVFFVKGAKNSAVCDTRSGNVYSLNSVATKQIESSCFGSELENFLAQLNLYESSTKGEEGVEDICAEKDFVWFEVTTSKCNLRCRHCYIGQTESDKISFHRLSVEKWKDVISEAYELGIRKCQFIGGEPFLFKNDGYELLDLCEFASERGYKQVEIFTNCQSVTRSMATRIKDLNLRIATSIYSSSESVHDAITQKKGSQRKTIEAVKMLLEAGVKVRVETVLMSLNQDTIEETISFLDMLGVRHRNPDPIRPTGSGSEASLTPNMEYQLKYGYYMEPNFSVSKRTFFRNKMYNSCLTNKFVITESGDVFPCVFARNVLYGNVNKHSLAEILKSYNVEKVTGLNKDNILVCKDCEYRYVCSDCRPLSADSYLVEDAFYNYPNPRCTYNPYMGVWGKGRWILKESELIYEPFS